MNLGRERIAVTGVGLVTALGLDAESTFRRLIDGERGFRPVSLFDVSRQRCAIAGEISELGSLAEDSRMSSGAVSRCSLMALAAAREAMLSSGVEPTHPLVLAIGTTNAGTHEAESKLAGEGADRAAAYAREIVGHPLASVADHVALRLGNVQRKATLCSACSSGALAIIQGAVWLELGVADRALVGGVDCLSLLTYTGFGVLGALAQEPCRPFDLYRAGLTLGEGAGFLLLERESVALARGASVVAWLTGWSVGAEAHHSTHPEPSGATAAQLIAQALARAGLGPAEIDYVNAHGTGTPPNDVMESLALRTALGEEMDRIWVSSSKGQLGHTLGGAGAIEAAITALAVGRSRVPPSGGLVTPDPSLRLRHVLERGLVAELRAALSTSFGFGGTGAVLVLEHPEAPGGRGGPLPRFDVVISSAVLLADEESEHVGAARIAPAQAVDGLDPDRSRRFGQGTALATAAAGEALSEARLLPGVTGLVLGVSHGHVERSLRFLERILDKGPRLAAPAEFPHLVPSAAAGNASVYLGLKGPVCMVSEGVSPGESALEVAMGWVQSGIGQALLVGSAAIPDPVVASAIGSLGLGQSQDWERAAAAFVALESTESAQVRGVRPLARLIALGRLARGLDEALVLREPVCPEQALVLCLGEEGGLRRDLAGSAWLGVRWTVSDPPRGAHDARGIATLADAAHLVAKGTAKEVLVWTVGLDSVVFAHLQAYGD